MDNATLVGRGLSGGVLLDACTTGIASRFGPWLYANPFLIKGVRGGQVADALIEDGSVEYANTDKVHGVEARPYALDVRLVNTQVRNIRVYYNSPQFDGCRVFYGEASSCSFQHLAATKVGSHPITVTDDFIEFTGNSSQNRVDRLWLQSTPLGGPEAAYPQAITAEHVAGTLTDSVLLDPASTPTQSVGAFAPFVRGTSSAGSARYSARNGTYIKIGRLVQFQLSVSWSEHPGAGDIEVAGLPFTYPPSPVGCAVAIGEADQFAINPGHVLSAFISGGASCVSFRQVPVGGGVASSVPLGEGASLLVAGSCMAVG